MRYFSMFSGIGGFEKGIEDAFNTEASGLAERNETSEILGSDMSNDTEQHGGHRAACIGFSELDPNAINIYKHHFPNHKGYGDATKINANELPDFDLLVGGFPCQAFSIAGQRRGFDDTRGTLFFDIARILRAKRPANFLLENVKGLLSHDNGNTFKTIITTLAEMGYSVEWEVLNSKNFGVPQNRERVFIHGFREGCGRQIFPLGGTDGEAGSGLEQVGVVGKNNEASRVYATGGAARTITNGGGMGAKTGLYAVRKNNGVIEETKDEALCLDKSYHKGFDNHGQRTGVFDGFRIRRLTPVECERLQGFPDDWTKYGADGKTMSDSARYKACGNAVTTNVIRAIMEAM